MFAFLAVAIPARAEAAQTAAVQAHLLWARHDRTDVERQLDRAKAAGAGMVRVDLGWASLERDRKGEYSSWYLQKIDHVVREAGARGVKILFTFWETPCWASAAPAALKQDCAGAWWDRDVQRYAPVKASDFGDALAFVVRRYGDRVAAWEIWNEPNHADYFKASDKVSSYAALVKAAYPAAKRADARATVVAGSLADADFKFTEALYAKGIKGSFDAWSVHPYSGDRSPLDRGDDRWIQNSFVRGVPAVRETLLRHGDDKPLWLTEFGWSTCTVRGLASYKNCVDPPVQASHLQLAYRQMQAWRYVPVGVWFNLQDTSAAAGDRVENYGLLTHQGAEKPAYAAFRRTASALHAGKPVPTSGTARTSATALKKQPIRIYVSRGAKRGRVLAVRGRVKGQTSGRVRLTAFYAKKGRRLRPLSKRRTVLRNGRFKARLARFRRGRWRVQAVLEGAPSAVDAKKFRLETEDGGAEPPPGVAGDGRRALGAGTDEERRGDAPAPVRLVGEARYDGPATPGPLPGGGYIGRAYPASRAVVSSLQSRLAAAGLGTPRDGVFGPRTEIAVRRFQQAHGLVVDGVVGRQTMAALEQYGGE